MLSFEDAAERGLGLSSQTIEAIAHAEAKRIRWLAWGLWVIVIVLIVRVVR